MTPLSKRAFHIALCATALAGCACGASPTSATPRPSSTVSAPPTPAPEGALPTTLTVTDGWTGSPVAGARVSAEGTDAVTDIGGEVQMTRPTGTCLQVAILARGYLQRRTCATSTITLWPVADEYEVDATKAAAFSSGDRLNNVYQGEIVLAPEVRQRPDLVAVWRAAADRVNTVTSGKLSLPIVNVSSGDDGYIVSFAGTPPTCRHPWFTWNFEVAGFCWDPTMNYFVQEITVSPERMGRVDVAVRALLYGTVLRPHSLRGLMNRTQPETDLSTFEEKTLRMMSLRWPTQARWPDFDP